MWLMFFNILNNIFKVCFWGKAVQFVCFLLVLSNLISLNLISSKLIMVKVRSSSLPSSLLNTQCGMLTKCVSAHAWLCISYMQQCLGPTLSITGRHPTPPRDLSLSGCLDTKMLFLNNQVISIFKQKLVPTRFCITYNPVHVPACSCVAVKTKKPLR